MAKAKRYTIGIDIGGTKIAAILFHHNQTVETSVLATPKDTLEHFLIMVQAVLDPLFERVKKTKGELTGIGVGVPGIIDPAGQRVIIARNVGILNKVKLLELLRARLGRPELAYALDNDVNCFIRAEATLGAARKSDNAYGLTIGTGIGGGWWLNGDIYRGAHNSASEPGHLVVDFDHLTTLEQAYHKLTQSNPAVLAQEARRGDRLAEKTFAELGAYLGIALSTIVNLIDPEMIVLGGGALASSDLFLTQAKDNLARHTFSPQARKTKIVKSKLGPMAGAIGAALLVK